MPPPRRLPNRRLRRGEEPGAADRSPGGEALGGREEQAGPARGAGGMLASLSGAGPFPGRVFPLGPDNAPLGIRPYLDPIGKVMRPHARG